MTINDSSTLASLMAAYEHSAVFESTVPNHFRMAKLFCEMRWSNGGLVLCGVSPDGTVIGVNPPDLDDIYEMFRELSSITRTRIEIGTIHLSGRTVVFLVFNTVPAHTSPLDRFAGLTSRVEFF